MNISKNYINNILEYTSGRLTGLFDRIEEREYRKAYNKTNCKEGEGKFINIDITKRQKLKTCLYRICDLKAHMTGMRAAIKYFENNKSNLCKENDKKCSQDINSMIAYGRRFINKYRKDLKDLEIKLERLKK